MNRITLKEIVREMIPYGKGILAMDESCGTCAKRFAKCKIGDSEAMRKSYRSMLVTTHGLDEYISAAILFDETIHHKVHGTVPFPQYLENSGIVPGIKVDTGLVDLAFHPGEKVTEGLDGLRERLQEYKGLGARFAKWRAVYKVGRRIPSAACIAENAHVLARYAAICQEQDMVPIIEPEVLIDGKHSIGHCQLVTTEVLQEVVFRLAQYNVFLEGVILKINMVTPGVDSVVLDLEDAVSHATLTCLTRAVPAAIPGVAFLSGGQSDSQAVNNLCGINRLKNKGNHYPWRLTFSFGRALHQSAMEVWGGKEENFKEAQAILLEQARRCALASIGSSVENESG